MGVRHLLWWLFCAYRIVTTHLWDSSDWRWVNAIFGLPAIVLVVGSLAFLMVRGFSRLDFSRLDRVLFRVAVITVITYIVGTFACDRIRLHARGGPQARSSRLGPRRQRR